MGRKGVTARENRICEDSGACQSEFLGETARRPGMGVYINGGGKSGRHQSFEAFQAVVKAFDFIL